MVLLSIKSKSYRRLHSAHYKQVVLKDEASSGFQVRSCWVGERKDTRGARNMDLISYFGVA